MGKPHGKRQQSSHRRSHQIAGLVDAPTARPKAVLHRAHLTDISPLTETQRQFVEHYTANTEALIVHGAPGTGKTFLSLYHALNEALTSKRQRRVVIVRSAVPSRSMGFLPGTEDDKLGIYQAPYRDMCGRMFQLADAYDRLTTQGTIEFMSTSYLRGMTWDDAIVLVDECQNMSEMELHTIMTRLGQRSRILFCGDVGQTDLTKASDRSGWPAFVSVLQSLPMVATIEYSADDIVRSPLVKAYLLARLRTLAPK